MVRMTRPRAHEHPPYHDAAPTGIYLVTFGLCLRALLLDRDHGFMFKPARNIRWGMVIVALLMFIFGTFDGASPPTPRVTAAHSCYASPAQNLTPF